MTELNRLQAIILWVTGVLALIILISCGVFSLKSANPLPAPPEMSNDQNLNTKIIANYKELAEEFREQRGFVFDKVITNTLQPALETLLTAILTFIFVQGGVQLFHTYVEWKKQSK